MIANLELTYHLNEIDQVALRLKSELMDEDIWVFEGQMGAGKTTLIKSLANAFQILDPVSSPTFGIVNEYSNAQGDMFFHFDFYRLDKSEEALDIGIEEYFYSGEKCWIEWAGKIEEYLPDQYVQVNIEILSGEKRKLSIEKVTHVK
ncbi:tRNA (adenosine(37)-N6)-threonylcarbamoyltransferase complex ATPase subunit type 1 TsaE [Algoriphagus namhaensis]